MEIMYNFYWNNINEEMIDDMVDSQNGDGGWTDIDEKWDRVAQRRRYVNDNGPIVLYDANWTTKK